MNNIFDRMSTRDDSVASDTSAEATQGVLPEAGNGNAAGVNAQTDSAPAQANVTEKAVKDAAQELLRAGTIDENVKPALFKLAVTYESRVNQVLEPFDLHLKLDTHRGVVWLAVNRPRDEIIVNEDISNVSSAEETDADEAWSHPLVRRQRLTLEQSLLVALLRQAFAMHEQKYGVGQGAARVAVDELLPQFLTYFTDTGSDSKNESRLLSLLDQLKTYAIVSEVDKNQEVTIRPMIAHLANPESLAALLKTLQAQAQGGGNRE